jgi:hypothetical protein
MPHPITGINVQKALFEDVALQHRLCREPMLSNPIEKVDKSQDIGVANPGPRSEKVTPERLHSSGSKTCCFDQILFAKQCGDP